MTTNTSASTAQVAHRPLILIACMLAMFMSAIEATIVATAMPTIIGDLGGFSLLGWVFSVYLLAQAITIPIYGRLADLYGRKPIFFFGATLFLLGSVLCGFSSNMYWLIAFRLLQGLGAGAIMPIATTVIGDIYSATERPKVMGYLSSVWVFRLFLARYWVHLSCNTRLGPWYFGSTCPLACWRCISWGATCQTSNRGANMRWIWRERLG